MTAAIALLLSALGALAAYGFATGHIFSQVIWTPDGLHRASLFLLVFGAVSLPVLAFAHKYFRPLTIAVVLAGTVVAVGPLPLLAVLLFLYSATVIGRAIFRVSEPLLALLAGVAVLIAIEEALVRLPWNYPWVYLLLLLLPFALAPRVTKQTFFESAALLRPFALESLWKRAAAAALALILTAHWLVVLKPEVSEDGLAMHLAIADGVAWKHRFAFDLAHNIWAAMPMGGDWCFTLVYPLGGEFAARLLNFAFLLVLTALLFNACRRFLGPAAALWIAALFAATPLVQLVTGSLFIENILAVILFGGVTALWRFEETAGNRYLYAAALLLGTTLHVKLGSLAFLLPALILLGFQIKSKWRALGTRPLTLCALTALIVVVAGLPPYVIATVKTGNPIFPFQNRTFHSPLLAPGVIVEEHRFHEPLRANTPYTLTFHSSRYYEGQDGSFGLQYLLLLPLGVLLIRRGAYAAWSATAIAACGFIAILVSQPNLRYLYPALPLLHVTIACALAGLAARPAFLRALTCAAFAAALGVDLYLFPSSNWYHKSFYSSPLFTASGRAIYLDEQPTYRVLIDNLNRTRPGEPVFLAEGSSIAGLRGPVFRNHWHDLGTQLQLDEAHDGDEVLELLNRWKVEQFIAPLHSAGFISKPVQDFDAACVEPDLRVSSYFSGHLTAACKQKLVMQTTRSNTLLRLGDLYDDTSARVELTGNWTRGQRFFLASGETVSYSNQPGAGISFPFEGTALTYVYTAAANRGIARISIDGAPRSDIDLYSVESQWQSTARFENLIPGKHVIEIFVTGRKHPGSQDSYVDLDAFAVKP